VQICFVLLCALLLLYRPINFPLSIFAHSRSLRYVFFKSFITLSHIVVFKLLSREREIDYLLSNLGVVNIAHADNGENSPTDGRCLDTEVLAKLYHSECGGEHTKQTNPHDKN
jgi:hypothetical protein